MIPLSGKYYVECNEVFRRSTNQAERMLERMNELTRGRSDLRILSVGSGAGLFEVPMLRELDKAVSYFVGVDVNSHACQVLLSKLDGEFDSAFEYEVVNQAFQDFQTDQRFDIVLFNHTFEYLDGDRLSWVQKSLDLLQESGSVLIFSPNRGGINKFYEEIFSPCFSEDLEQLLSKTEFPHSTSSIEAECDLSLLANDDPNKIRLLSFLTQVDCREVPPTTQQEFINYYLALGGGQGSVIAHPTTLFIL